MKDRFTIIYSKGSKIKAVDLDDAVGNNKKMLSEGWVHTATINPNKILEVLFESKDPRVELDNLTKI